MKEGHKSVVWSRRAGKKDMGKASEKERGIGRKKDKN